MESRMVIVIMSDAGTSRDSLGRLLAESLGWDFVDADHLRRIAKTTEHGISLADTGWDIPMQALFAALQYWNYQWRDVVVACPTITEQDQRQLSSKYCSVKFVRLNQLEGTEQPLYKAFGRISSGLLMSRGMEIDGSNKVLTIDSSQRAERIVAEVISALVLNRRPTQVSAA
jgi:gluconokinase